MRQACSVYGSRRKLATLDTKVKKLEDNKTELTVTIPAEEVTKGVAAAYKKAAKVRIPGFRLGKAPRHVLENYYGGKDYFLSEATEELINTWFPLALEAENLIPLKKAEFSLDILVVEGESYTFSAELIVKPDMELSSYEPVQVELPSDKVTEEEIERQIESLREYYISYDDVDGRVAQDGDTVILDLKSTLNGEIVEGLSTSGLPYEIGSKTMPEQFDENIKGMEVGEEKEFDFSFDEDPLEVMGEGDKMHVKAKLVSVRTKVLPEVTDAWVKATLDYEGVEDLRDKITVSIQSQKSQQLPELKEIVCQHELVSRLIGEPPSEMVRNAEQGIYRDFFNMLQKRNMSFDQYLINNDITPEEFQKDTKAQAFEGAAAGLALDALARHLELTVAEEEVIAEFEFSGAEDTQKLLAEWKESGRLPEIREGLLRMKAAQHLVSTAEVFDIGQKPEAKPVKKASAKKSAKASEKDAPIAETKKTPAKKATKTAKVESDAGEDKPVEKKTRSRKPKTEE